MLKILKEAYNEEEGRDIYELARTWDGDNRHDELEESFCTLGYGDKQ